MPKAEPRKTWVALATLEIERPALSVQYVEEGKGSNKRRILAHTGWLDADGETILMDVGKRLKGWLKAQAMTLGGETKRDTLGYGVVCKSLPQAGYVPIAKLSDILPSRSWESFSHKGEYILNHFPAPEVEAILTTEGRSVFSFHYVIGKPVTAQAKIYCFARGFTPDNMKNWLVELGPIKGIGDKYSSSEGFGTFTLKEWKVESNRELLY